jgi:hypothetical protein
MVASRATCDQLLPTSLDLDASVSSRRLPGALRDKSIGDPQGCVPLGVDHGERIGEIRASCASTVRRNAASALSRATAAAPDMRPTPHESPRRRAACADGRSALIVGSVSNGLVASASKIALSTGSYVRVKIVRALILCFSGVFAVPSNCSGLRRSSRTIRMGRDIKRV